MVSSAISRLITAAGIDRQRVITRQFKWGFACVLQGTTTCISRKRNKPCAAMSRAVFSTADQASPVVSKGIVTARAGTTVEMACLYTI